jgi:uncharacterized protein (DUF3084 family)
LQIDDHQEVS